MSIYDSMPMCSTDAALAAFMGGARSGMAAEYNHGDIKCRTLAWNYACKGEATLFRRRASVYHDFQFIIIRLSAEAARKLGPPVRKVEWAGVQ